MNPSGKIRTGNIPKFYLIACVVFAICAGELAGQQVKAVFIETAPKIDGEIKEPIWQQAAVVTEFLQREPHTGAPATERTVVRVCYDKNNLYLGFQCYQDPKTITAKEIERDATLADDDKVVIILDTFRDLRNAYWLEINPRGSKGDALLSQNGAVMNKEWDGIWDGRSTIHAEGWDAEVAIPFKTLNFHPTETTWGLKFVRDIQYKSEFIYWPVANLNTYEYQVSDAGSIVGLTGITQGIGLDIRPYVLGSINQIRDVDLEYDGDVGFDLFYQLTPGIKSVLTVNTDFAQTEVDDRQVNLTRFPLFFPEKRDFFLDGSNYFKFAIEGADRSPKSQQLIPFFSRRIGLGERGVPIPILGGVKVTGQNGPWSLGILNVIDQRETGNQNFAVLRVNRNLGEQSALGVIATHGNAESTQQNMVFGADLKLATSKLKGDKNLVYYLYGLKSSTENQSGRDTALGTEISYPNDFLSFKVGYMQIDSNFVAGVGFIPRTNIRNTYAEIGIGPRPKKWGILQVQSELEFDYITDFDNRLITREISFEPLGIRFLSGDQVSVELNHQYEAIDEEFNIHRDYTIPAGTHEFLRPEIRLSSARRRPLWGEIDVQWGDFWNGTAEQLQVNGGYKICVPIALVLAYENNNVTLPEGAFQLNVYRVNVDLLFSPRLSLKTFVQYDDESQNIGWQSRFRWILKPGNEILFVWNSLWNDPMDRWNPHLKDFTLAESTTQLKINYNYRF